MKLRINGGEKVLQEGTIEVFKQTTFDGKLIKLSVKASGKCIIHNNFQFLGWTEDSHLAFDIWNNRVPISTLQELFDNRI